jgi:hypothetical protein
MCWESDRHDVAEGIRCAGGFPDVWTLPRPWIHCDAANSTPPGGAQRTQAALLRASPLAQREADGLDGHSHREYLRVEGGTNGRASCGRLVSALR